MAIEANKPRQGIFFNIEINKTNLLCYTTPTRKWDKIVKLPLYNYSKKAAAGDYTIDSQKMQTNYGNVYMLNNYCLQIVHTANNDRQDGIDKVASQRL